jgi:uncharacterized protein
MSLLISTLAFISLYIFINVFVYKQAKTITTYYGVIKKTIIYTHILLLILVLSLLIFIGKPHLHHKIFTAYFHFNFLFFLYLIFIIFLGISLFVNVIVSYFHIRGGNKKTNTNKTIILTASILIAVVWSTLFYGYFYGVANFQIKKHELTYENLPESFDGIRIVHFSDTHLGSFLNKKNVEKGVDLIKAQNADMVFFTGDLVNISANEAKPYIRSFASIEAPLGKFAVLGNHDMSDYRKADIPRDSINVNIIEIVEVLQKMGFTVLRDSSVYIKLNTDSIAIAGTDNWGKPPFKQTGDLEKAISRIDEKTFTILLTHDPSLWESEIKDKKNIELTLSGHTHGMQMGIRTNSIRFSPASLKYKTWSGIYGDSLQKNKLHVNQGFGFIGLPIRVGIYPEITIINLRRK